jgi:hypothetical protein
MDTQPIIQLLTVAMLSSADGISDIETQFCKNIAEDLDVTSEFMEQEIKKYAAEISTKNEEDFDAFITEVAQKIPAEDALFVFELVLGVITVDNLLDIPEISIASVIADALNLPSYEIITAVAQIVHHRKKLEIEVE